MGDAFVMAVRMSPRTKHNDRIALETSIDVDSQLTHEHRFSRGDVNHRELHAPFSKLHALVGRCPAAPLQSGLGRLATVSFSTPLR
jgi:hypothetical protein